jgi:hypothetical protein
MTTTSLVVRTKRSLALNILPDSKKFSTEIKLGAFYDPLILYYDGGPLFVHNVAQLKQHNIVNVNGSLVPLAGIRQITHWNCRSDGHLPPHLRSPSQFLQNMQGTVIYFSPHPIA